MRTDQKKSFKDKKPASGGLKQSVSGYSKKTALLEDAITQMNAGKYGRSSAALKELLALDPHNMEARRLFATLHLRLGSLIPARQAFDSLIDEAFQRQDYWLAESLLREYLAAASRCVPYLEKLGSIHEDKGETLEAIAEYAKAVEVLIEDPDPDNPTYASRFYQKIKSLAPMGPVAARLAYYFDPQTGAVIDRSPAAGAEESSTELESVPAAASEPVSETMPVELQDDSFSIKESESLSDSPEIRLEESPLSQHTEEAVQGAAGWSSSLVNGVSAISLEPEPAQSVPEISVLDSSQQSSMANALPEEIHEPAIEQAVPAPMPWEGIEEKASGMPENAITEPPHETPPAPTADQAPAATYSGGVKGGEFSWDSVFKDDWKFGRMAPTKGPVAVTEQNETRTIGEPAASTSSPAYLQEIEPATIEIPRADREACVSGEVDAPPMAEPMPWDQVEESAITIPHAQTEEAAGESLSIGETTFSAGQEEQAEWSYQDSSQEEAGSISVLQPAAEETDTSAFPIAQSSPASPGPSSDETDFILADDASTSCATDEQYSGEIGAQSEDTFSFAGESSVSVEPVDVEPPTVSTDLAQPDHGAVRLETQDGHGACSLQEESVDSGPATEGDVATPVLDPAPVPPAPTEDPLPWKTGGEMAETDHLSSLPHDQGEELVSETVSASTFSEEPAPSGIEPEEWKQPSFADAKDPHSESTSTPQEWNKPGESIRFAEEPRVATASMPQRPAWEEQSASAPVSAAAAAVDVLYEASSGHLAQTEASEPAAQSRTRRKAGLNLGHVAAAISDFFGSCFSTTRAIVLLLVGLVVLSGALVGVGIGVVGLTWMVMEEPPSPTFKSFSAVPPQTLSDLNTNGYLLLLGFEAPLGQNSIQAGYERKPDGKDAERVLACLGGSGDGVQAGQTNASAKVLSGWFKGRNPVRQFMINQGSISGWASQGEGTLGRYRQWQRLAFDDWGYGQAVAPPCAAITFAHHLYVAEGFVRGADIGIERIEKDMEAWRMVLSQAKSLPVKALAIQAINDDAAVASGLLAQPDFDVSNLGRLAKMLRPLDQAGLSLRWPMQSELAYAAKSFDAQLKAEKEEGLPMHVAIASALPLPKQRRLNDYAEYYEAFENAAADGRYNALPKLSGYIRSPAASFMDYFTNPIENVIGLQPLQSWDLYNGLVVDTEARLRLASLQAWIRRGPPDADIISRIAKAGQNFYDPYTGMPMLMNKKMGALYSVGHDGKDQDADPQYDVVVAIPASPAAAPVTSSSDPSASY